MSLSEGKARIVPHTKLKELIQSEQRSIASPDPRRQAQADPVPKMKDVARSETQPVASGATSQILQADPPGHGRVIGPASSHSTLDKDGNNNISHFEPGSDSNRVLATRNLTVTREMPTAEGLKLLGAHGCEDVTNQLDTSKFSEYPISSGGYGDVYKGAFRNGNTVAVKSLRLHTDSSEVAKKQLKRAARELYVWSKCNHPNVLGLIGVAQYRDRIAMVSPWMEHGSLRRLLFRGGEVDRYSMCAQITDGVAYMHSENVVHGDLKCDNILVSSDLTPKLTDFGNASLKEYTLQFTNTTSSDGISLNWVAPEMLTGQNYATMESDVYSLGMTMLEVITREVPYNGMSQPMIMFAKVMTKTPPVRPEAHLPLQTGHADLLWSLFESCWAFNPGDRPTASEVKAKMEQVAAARESGNPSG